MSGTEISNQNILGSSLKTNRHSLFISHKEIIYAYLPEQDLLRRKTSVWEMFYDYHQRNPGP